MNRLFGITCSLILPLSRTGRRMLFALMLSNGLILVGSASANSVQPLMIEPQTGTQYFTRYSFKAEKGKHNTTNYWRGDLVPINSQVTLLSLGKKKMVIELEGGRRITFINAAKYTKRRVATIASELLSPKRIPLDGLKTSIRQAIESGEMMLGMTKEEVIMARGYPPRHKTPSTDEDFWTYWSSKFVKRTIVFDDGVLTEGRGLQ